MSVLVSGGFDPIHPGHIAMINDAARYGAVIVALNSDEWLVRKKGFVFQTWDNRAEILRSITRVYCVAKVDDRDGTVVEALTRLRPAYFANGGDRTSENTPELKACAELGIKPVFGIGGGKASSSSAIAAQRTVRRSWGTYEVFFDGPWGKVKRLAVDPKSKSSIQRHFHRAEVWFYPDGTFRHIPVGEWHQLANDNDEPLEIIEVQIGDCREDDIERK